MQIELLNMSSSAQGRGRSLDWTHPSHWSGLAEATEDGILENIEYWLG
jgi:hypothetical protein